MSGRFPGFVPQDWRSRLVVDHPRLFPGARLVRTVEGSAVVCAGWPAVPEGWRHLVETACDRLDEATSAEPGVELAITDIGQKFARLRIRYRSSNLGPLARDAVELIVDLAEARSIHVCEICGGEGRLSRQHGWVASRCPTHAEGRSTVRGHDPDLQVTTRFTNGEIVRTARRYDFATDSFVPAAVPADEE